MTPYSMSGSRTSRVYTAWPVTLARASTRGTGLPTTRSRAAASHGRGSSSGMLRVCGDSALPYPT